MMPGLQGHIMTTFLNLLLTPLLFQHVLDDVYASLPVTLTISPLRMVFITFNHRCIVPSPAIAPLPHPSHLNLHPSSTKQSQTIWACSASILHVQPYSHKMTGLSITPWMPQPWTPQTLTADYPGKIPTAPHRPVVVCRHQRSHARIYSLPSAVQRPVF